MKLIRRPGVLMMPSIRVMNAIVPCHQHGDNSTGRVGKHGTALAPMGKLLCDALGCSLRSDDSFAGTVVAINDTQAPPGGSFSFLPRGSKYITPSITTNCLGCPMDLEAFGGRNLFPRVIPLPVTIGPTIPCYRSARTGAMLGRLWCMYSNTARWLSGVSCSGHCCRLIRLEFSFGILHVKLGCRWPQNIQWCGGGLKRRSHQLNSWHVSNDFA